MKTNNKASNNKRLCISALLISVLLAGVMTQATVTFGASSNNFYLKQISSETLTGRQGTSSIQFLPLDAGFKLFVASTDLDAGTATEKYIINAYTASIGSSVLDTTVTTAQNYAFPAGTVSTIVNSTAGDDYYVRYSTVDDLGTKHKFELIDKAMAVFATGYVLGGAATLAPQYMFPFGDGLFMIGSGETLMLFTVADLPTTAPADYATYVAGTTGITNYTQCVGCNYYGPAMNAGALNRIVTREGTTLSIRDPTAMATVVVSKSGFDVSAKTVVNKGTNELLVYDSVAKIYFWDWAAYLADDTTGFGELNLQATFGNMFYQLESIYSTANRTGYILTKELIADGKRGIFRFDLTTANSETMHEVNSIESSGTTDTYQFAIGGIAGATNIASVMATISSGGKVNYFSADCHADCLTCNLRDDAAQCITCSDPLKNINYTVTAAGPPHVLAAYGSCVSACTQGWYNDTITKECKYCEANPDHPSGPSGECLQCQGSASYCTQCSTATLYLHQGSCLAAGTPNCPDGFFDDANGGSIDVWGTATDINVCSACNSTCGTCGAAAGDECLTCAVASDAINPKTGTTVAPGTCVVDCPDGFFRSSAAVTAPANQLCIACEGTCGTCKDNNADNTADANECTSCATTTDVLQPATAGEDFGTCIAAATGCNTGFYSANTTLGDVQSVNYCFACDSTCETCVGPKADDCMGCASGATENTFRQNDLTLNTSLTASGQECFNAPKGCRGTCIATTTCGEGFFEASNVCTPCQPGCKTCSDATTCTECFDNQFTRPLDAGNSLLLKCTTNCSALTDYTDNSYYNDASDPANPVCSLCHATCDTCTGPDASDCLKCRTGLTPDTVNLAPDGRCLENCPDGYFTNPVATQPKNCLACNETCFTCAATGGDQCSECKGSLFKQEATFGASVWECVTSCPSTHYLNLAAQTCYSCDAPTAEEGNAMPGQNCLSCTGKTIEQCLTCKGVLIIKGKGTAGATCHDCQLLADFTGNENLCQFSSPTKSFINYTLHTLGEAERLALPATEINTKILFNIEFSYRSNADTDAFFNSMSNANLNTYFQLDRVPSGFTANLEVHNWDLATKNLTVAAIFTTPLPLPTNEPKVMDLRLKDGLSAPYQLSNIGSTAGVTFYLVDNSATNGHNITQNFRTLCLPYQVAETANCVNCWVPSVYRTAGYVEQCQAPNKYSMVDWNVTEDRIEYFDPTIINKKFHFKATLNYRVSADFTNWVSSLDSAKLNALLDYSFGVVPTGVTSHNMVFDSWDEPTKTIKFHITTDNPVTANFAITFSRPGTGLGTSFNTGISPTPTINYYLNENAFPIIVNKFCLIDEVLLLSGQCHNCTTPAGFIAQPSACKINTQKSFIMWSVTPQNTKFTGAQQNMKFVFDITLEYEKNSAIDSHIFNLNTATGLNNHISVTPAGSTAAITTALGTPTLAIEGTTDLTNGANITVSVTFGAAIPEDVNITFYTHSPEDLVFFNTAPYRYSLVNKTEVERVTRDCTGTLIRMDDGTCYDCSTPATFGAKRVSCKTREPFKSFISWSTSRKTSWFQMNDTRLNNVFYMDLTFDYNPSDMLELYLDGAKNLDGKISFSSTPAGVATVESFTKSNRSMLLKYTFSSNITADTTVTLAPADTSNLLLTSDANNGYYIVNKQSSVQFKYTRVPAPPVVIPVVNPKPFTYQVFESKEASDSIETVTKVTAGATAVLSIASMPLSVATVPLVAGPVSGIQAFGKLAFLPVDTGKTMGGLLYTLDDSTLPTNGNSDAFYDEKDDSTSGSRFVSSKELSTADLGTGEDQLNTALGNSTTTTTTSSNGSRVLQNAPASSVTTDFSEYDFQLESNLILRSCPLIALALLGIALINGILRLVFQVKRSNPLMKILTGIEYLIMIFGLVELSFNSTFALFFAWDDLNGKHIINKLLAVIIWGYYFFRFFRLFSAASKYPSMTHEEKTKKAIEVAIVSACMRHDKLPNQPVRIYHVFSLVKLFLAMVVIVLLQDQGTVCLIVNLLLMTAGLGYYIFITTSFKCWANNFAMVAYALLESSLFMISLTALILSMQDDVDEGAGNLFQIITVILILVTVVALLIFMVYSIITLLMNMNSPNQVDQDHSSGIVRKRTPDLENQNKNDGFNVVGGNSNRGQIDVNGDDKKNIVRRDIDEEQQK